MRGKGGWARPLEDPFGDDPEITIPGLALALLLADPEEPDVHLEEPDVHLEKALESLLKEIAEEEQGSTVGARL